MATPADVGAEIRHRRKRDGVGGLLVFWSVLDSSGSLTRVQGQYVSAHGRTLWGAEGRTLAQFATSSVSGPIATSDGAQGAIVAWASGQGPALELHATRITRDGGLPWQGGVLLRSKSGLAWGLQLAPTRDGGAIATWLDAGAWMTSGNYAQRVSHRGRVLWGPMGTPVCTAPGGHSAPVVVSDGRDGAYVAWSDARAAGKLYATHLDPRGHAAAGWAVDGSVISPWQDVAGYPTSQIDDGPYLIATGRDEAMVSWDSYQRVLSRNDVISVEQSFAMLLTPDGPATSPAGVQRSPSAVEPASLPAPSDGPAFALYGIHPNPAFSGASVSFALPDAQPAMLELFDVAGRRVWSREVGGLGTGDHAVRLRDGAWSPPGLYLVRLKQGEHVATTRVAIVR